MKRRCRSTGAQPTKRHRSCLGTNGLLPSAAGEHCKVKSGKSSLEIFIVYELDKRNALESTTDMSDSNTFCDILETVHTMGYYAAEKNDDIMKFAGKWMELENVILSECEVTFEVLGS
ncbi:hypothetical protein STEG23_015736 [Scotinomys teguina]